MSRGESSGPSGMGSAARDDGRAPLRGEYVRQQPLGGLRAPPRRHHHQHPAEVRDDVDADDLRPAHTAGTGAPAPAGHALAVDRHGDPRPHRGVRGPGSPGAPPVHQDPHAARRDTQRSGGHLHLRRAGPARRGAVDGPPYRQHRHRRVPAPARTGGRDRRYRARAIAATAAAPRRRAGPLLAVGRRRERRRRRPGRRCGALSSTCRRSGTPPAISTSCMCTTTT